MTMNVAIVKSIQEWYGRFQVRSVVIQVVIQRSVIFIHACLFEFPMGVVLIDDLQVTRDLKSSLR